MFISFQTGELSSKIQMSSCVTQDAVGWWLPRHYSSDGKYVTVASGKGDPKKDILVDVYKDQWWKQQTFDFSIESMNSSIAQKEASFFGWCFCWRQNCRWKKKHCQNGSLLVDYTLEEIRGKADIKKLNCNIGAKGAVILFWGDFE